MLKELTCFTYNEIPHTVIYCDLNNERYWCACVDFYGLKYYWLDMSVVDNIVNNGV